jgi:AcrR family transcriptional regulator
MRQPEITKLLLLEKSASLFNVKGFKATSISDITDATGLTKGAIYRHFANKDELEAASLDFMFDKVKSQLKLLIKSEKDASSKLFALFNFFETYIHKPIIPGGCPFLNASIEVDDANPKLRAKVIEMYEILKGTIKTILQNGIKYKQINKNTDVETIATVIICSLEGGIVASKVSMKNKDMRLIIRFLTQVVDDIKIEQNKNID